MYINSIKQCKNKEKDKLKVDKIYDCNFWIRLQFLSKIDSAQKSNLFQLAFDCLLNFRCTHKKINLKYKYYYKKVESQFGIYYKGIRTLLWDIKYMLFRNSFQGVIRESQYLIWRREIHLRNNKYVLQDIIEFRGIADLNLPLLDVFLRFLPTKKILSKELIQFMRIAIKVYRVYKQDLQVLLQQFFGKQISSRNPEVVLAIFTLKQMWKNPQTNKNQTKYNLESLPSAFQINSHNEKHLVAQLKRKWENNLRLYSIIPRKVKIARLKALAQKLHPKFFTQISIDNNSVTLRLKAKETSHLFVEVVPLELLLQSTDIIYDIDHQLVQSASLRLLQEIQNFHKCTEDFYKQKNAQIKRAINSHNVSFNKKYSSLKQIIYEDPFIAERDRKELNESYLILTPQNVIFQLEKISNDKNQLLNQDFGFKKEFLKSQFRQKKFKVMPDSCSIDISMCFLQELGISFGLPGEKTKTGPRSMLDQITYFYPLPPLTTFNFLPLVDKLQIEKNLKDVRVNEIVSVLSWLCVVSAITSKLLQKRQQSIYQANYDSETVFQFFRNKNQSSVLSSNIKTMLLMFQMQTDQAQSVLQFQFSDWLNFLKQDEQNPNCDFEKHKFDKAKLLLQTRDELYFGTENFKQIIEKTNFFPDKKNIERYIHLFLLAKFIQLAFEQQILEMYEERVDNIKSQKYCLTSIIDKHQYIFRKVREKISKEYALRSMNDPNRTIYQESPIFKKNGEKNSLYNRLIHYNYGDFTKIDQKIDGKDKENQITCVQSITFSSSQKSKSQSYMLTELEQINRGGQDKNQGNYQQSPSLGKYSIELRDKRIKQIADLKKEVQQWIRQFIKPFNTKQNKTQKTQVITENMIIIKKNLLQLEIIFGIDEHNYCQMKRIEANLQSMKQTFANQTKISALQSFYTTMNQEILSLSKKKL